MKSLILLTLSFFQVLAKSLPNQVPFDGFDLSHFDEQVFGTPNEESGRLLLNWNQKSGLNAEEMGNYFEGDILMPLGVSRSALSSTKKRWLGGVVPYVIEGDFSK